MRGAITFDFHNTLVRCDAWFEIEVRTLPLDVARSLRELGRWGGLPGDSELVATYTRLRREIIEHGNELDAVDGVIETFRRHGVDIDRRSIEPIVGDLFASLVASSTLVDGVHETLEHLHARRVPIGVVSSAVHHPFLELALEHLGIRRFFTTIVTSASSGFYKSRPEIFHNALAEMGAEQSQSIHVGDSFRFDHLGGRAAGLQTVWLNEPQAPHPEGQPRPSLELDSLVGAGPRIFALLAIPAHAH
jgi:HAD superfamily hydrolase (TIGR01549 family)